MEISSSSLAAQQLAINKASVGQDILSKTLAKAAETDKQTQQAQQGQQSGKVDLLSGKGAYVNIKV